MVPCTSREKHQWIKPCYFIIASFVWIASCITSYVPSLNGCPVLKSWTNPGHGVWSAIAWHSEANTVDQSWQLWRVFICCHARRASYINGSLESTWKMVGKQWMDSSSCSRWHSNSWKGWLFFKGVACIQTRHAQQVTAAALYTLIICYRT